ncbi:MAG: hypothetical protein JOY71_22185, partial [Acetobacteraceae bacterium]|nr:hypothetical protein [Acetobacteraceae bacterium]
MYPVAIAKVVQTMGGGRVLGASPGSVGELAEAVAKGLPREVANEVAAHATTDRDMQKRLRNLVVPPASYKRSPVLSPSSSQKAERLARITALAQTAFGDAQEAQAWLTHP